MKQFMDVTLCVAGFPCIRREVTAWAKCRLIDIKSGGKKDTCKIAAEIKEGLPECRIVGGVAAKKGKGKK